MKFIQQLVTAQMIDGTWKLQDDSSTEAIISANGEVLRILGGTSVATAISGNDLTINLDTSSVVTTDGTTTLSNKTIGWFKYRNRYNSTI